MTAPSSELILTGSTISQMEDLQAERNPLHGRLRPLPLWPMPFAPATLLLPSSDVLDQLTRYSIAGGYTALLDAIAGGALAPTIARAVVDPHRQLFLRAPPDLLLRGGCAAAVSSPSCPSSPATRRDVASV